MFNKKLFLVSTMVILLVSLFVFAGSAVANIGGNCGKAGGTVIPGLHLNKLVDCSISRLWDLNIDKSVDQPELTLSPGQKYIVKYTVTVSAQATDSHLITGEVQLTNTTDNMVPPGYPIWVDSLTDSLGAFTSCPIPGTVNPGLAGQVNCTFAFETADAVSENTATAVVGSVSKSVTVPIDWSKASVTETQVCADVVDSFNGLLGTVCSNNAPQTFTYSREIGPYPVCSEDTVKNTAELWVDKNPIDSSSATIKVTVPCTGGCSLTPGYWKTHSSFGPAPYDDTWAQLGENTLFFFSGKSYYQALWTSPQGNAYWILAHAYIAAKLNQLNGADFTAAQAASNQATTLFQTYTPAQVGALRGNSTLRQQFVSLAATLDNYNNGLIGPGHCSE